MCIYIYIYISAPVAGAEYMIIMVIITIIIIIISIIIMIIIIVITLCYYYYYHYYQPSSDRRRQPSDLPKHPRRLHPLSSDRYIYLPMYISLSLSLHIYIYIYIYIDRERDIDREIPCVVLQMPEALDCRALIPLEAWNGLSRDPPSLGFERQTSCKTVAPQPTKPSVPLM